MKPGFAKFQKFLGKSKGETGITHIAYSLSGQGSEVLFGAFLKGGKPMNRQGIIVAV
jgi:hypothetical protein